MRWGISRHDRGVYDIWFSDGSQEWLAFFDRAVGGVEIWELLVLDVPTLAHEEYLGAMVGSFAIGRSADLAAIAAELCRWLPIVRRPHGAHRVVTA